MSRSSRGRFSAAAIAFIVLAIPALASTAPPKKEPAAVLAVVSGPVVVLRGEERLPGAFGFSLQGGDVVETGSGASAGVIFVTGQIIDLGPGSRITIGSIPAKASGNKQGGDLVAQVPDALAGNLTRFAQTSSGEQGLSALPTLREGRSANRLEALAPRRTLVEAGTPTFEWNSVADALEYRVHLAGPGGANGTHSTEKTRWTPDAGQALKAGEHWTWSVEAVTADGPVTSETYSFEVADEPANQAVKSLSDRLEPLLAGDDETRADAARYLLGSYCRSMGFYSAAIPHMEALVIRYPARSELHRELGYLYQAVGRNDRAAEEYRLALEE